MGSVSQLHWLDAARASEEFQNMMASGRAWVHEKAVEAIVGVPRTRRRVAYWDGIQVYDEPGPGRIEVQLVVPVEEPPK